AVDIVWAGFITLFTAGPASPFFVFFVFVLLAAAYRWGFPGALLTAAAAILVLFLESIPAIWPVYIGQYLETRFHLNRYVLLGTYLFVMAVLLGYVAEAEKLLRSETSAIGRIMRKTQEETTLARTIHVISDAVPRLSSDPFFSVCVVHQWRRVVRPLLYPGSEQGRGWRGGPGFLSGAPVPAYPGRLQRLFVGPHTYENRGQRTDACCARAA